MQLITKLVPDFFAMKGSIKSTKPFDIQAMEKAVEDATLNRYAKKLSKKTYTGKFKSISNLKVKEP